MNDDNPTSVDYTTAPLGVGDAEGVEKMYWYVAIVKNNTEKAVAERLSKSGITHYLPIQSTFRIWKNGRKVKVDRVVIPSMIFINCSERERRHIVTFPYINRFMMNKASCKSGIMGSTLATIPDAEIRRLKFMLGQSDIPVSITDAKYHVGDRVKVIRGSLSGLEGEVMDLRSSKTEVRVNFSFIGCARLLIETINLELIPSN